MNPPFKSTKTATPSIYFVFSATPVPIATAETCADKKKIPRFKIVQSLFASKHNQLAIFLPA